MIPYSLNTEIRKQVTVVLILISICVTAVFEYTLGKYFICIKNQSEFFNFISSLNSFKLLVEVTVPSFFWWWVINLLYSKCLWKLPVLQLVHHIPNLNGNWKGETTNYKTQKSRDVSVVIKQDWYTIRVQTEIIDSNKESGVQSFCECTVAAIDLNYGKLKYAYKNALLGENSYVGYNELEIEKNKIFGNYITTKPTKGFFKISKDE